MEELNALQTITTKGAAFTYTNEVVLESASTSRQVPLEILYVVNIALPYAFHNVVEKTLYSKLSPIQ